MSKLIGYLEIEIEGKKYTFHKDPTLAAVEKVMVFDELLRIGFIDFSMMKPEDMEKSSEVVLQEQGKTKPRILAQYYAKLKLSGVLKTVMICTGLDENELQDAPLKSLFEESVKVMGGTASDFFLDFNGIIQESEILTKTRHPGYEKISGEPSRNGDSNANDSQKGNKHKIDVSGNSG